VSHTFFSFFVPFPSTFVFSPAFLLSDRFFHVPCFLLVRLPHSLIYIYIIIPFFVLLVLLLACFLLPSLLGQFSPLFSDFRSLFKSKPVILVEPMSQCFPSSAYPTRRSFEKTWDYVCGPLFPPFFFTSQLAFFTIFFFFFPAKCPLPSVLGPTLTLMNPALPFLL